LGSKWKRKKVEGKKTREEKKIHEGKAISLCLRKVKIERKKGEKLISHGEHFEE
jgi:type II secretory pathway component PulF